jgi:YesN/AraC family two-component response regulator
MLQSLGYHQNSIACASNGTEALEILQQRPVDVILMDVQMPM